VNAASVTRAALLESARNVVDGYFRDTRLRFDVAGVSADALSALDAALQSLLEATHSRTPTTKYKSILKTIRSVSIDLEKRLLAAAGARRALSVGDVVDQRIVKTLQTLVPSAALAYEQAMLDLANKGRLSWRGPATDFREALRETLDHLAPDGAVVEQPGYKPEPNTNGPTMKQKVRYVLRQRNKLKAAVESAEAAVESVDGIVGGFVRSVYSRSSVSTHTPTNRDEVIRVREFVKVALCELLEIRVA
jgi:hypothetical protein